MWDEIQTWYQAHPGVLRDGALMTTCLLVLGAVSASAVGAWRLATLLLKKLAGPGFVLPEKPDAGLRMPYSDETPEARKEPPPVPLSDLARTILDNLKVEECRLKSACNSLPDPLAIVVGDTGIEIRPYEGSVLIDGSPCARLSGDDIFAIRKEACAVMEKMRSPSEPDEPSLKEALSPLVRALDESEMEAKLTEVNKDAEGRWQQIELAPTGFVHCRDWTHTYAWDNDSRKWRHLSSVRREGGAAHRSADLQTLKDHVHRAHRGKWTTLDVSGRPWALVDAEGTHFLYEWDAEGERCRLVKAWPPIEAKVLGESDDAFEQRWEALREVASRSGDDWYARVSRYPLGFVATKGALTCYEWSNGEWWKHYQWDLTTKAPPPEKTLSAQLTQMRENLKAFLKDAMKPAEQPAPTMAAGVVKSEQNPTKREWAATEALITQKVSPWWRGCLETLRDRLSSCSLTSTSERERVARLWDKDRQGYRTFKHNEIGAWNEIVPDPVPQKCRAWRGDEMRLLASKEIAGSWLDQLTQLRDSLPREQRLLNTNEESQFALFWEPATAQTHLYTFTDGKWQEKKA